MLSSKESREDLNFTSSNNDKNLSKFNSKEFKSDQYLR